MIMNSLQFSTITVCQDHLFHLAPLWISHFPYPSALSPLFFDVLNVPSDSSTLTLVCLLYHPPLPLATMARGSSHCRSRGSHRRPLGSHLIFAVEDTTITYHTHTLLEIQVEIDLDEVDFRVLRHFISNES